MRKIMDLKADGFNYICKFDEKASSEPYRVYLSAYVMGEDGFPHNRTKQLGRFESISEVLFALATVKQNENK